jgi:hypothetical protein
LNPNCYFPIKSALQVIEYLPQRQLIKLLFFKEKEILYFCNMPCFSVNFVKPY